MRLKLIHFVLLLFTAYIALSQKRAEINYQELNQDTAITFASQQYSKFSLFKIFMGRNYRKTWETKVKLPVFYLSQTDLTIQGLGGHHQTKSLKLKDQNNNIWVLRSVDKNVKAGVPKWLHNTPVQKFKQDLISADFPYGAVVVGELLKAANVLAPDPTYYFVAADDGLGEHYPLFANTVCMLEKWAPTLDGSPSEDSETVIDSIHKDNKYRVVQKQVLKVRILDMVVADWDRHKDQWRWGKIDSGNHTYFYPIPRDRDHALFYTTGLLPKLLASTFIRYMSGFQKNCRDLKRLNKKAWSFDRIFLNELDRNDWVKAITEIQNELTDSVIKVAVNKIPREVATLEGPAIKDKLITRRNELLNNVLDYYRFLSKEVKIQGTKEDELFRITDENEKVRVTVYRMTDGKVGSKIYERFFDPSETHSIKLDASKGNDLFQVSKSTQSKIKLKIMGGKESSLPMLAHQGRLII